VNWTLVGILAVLAGFWVLLLLFIFSVGSGG
jgi:hypothetical protein